MCTMRSEPATTAGVARLIRSTQDRDRESAQWGLPKRQPRGAASAILTGGTGWKSTPTMGGAA